jgi:hypothetical protein
MRSGKGKQPKNRKRGEPMLGTTILEKMIVILFSLSPFIFIAGLFILMTQLEKYRKLESVLGKEIGGIKKRIIPAIETNIYSFHNWLMKKKLIIGVIGIILSVVLFGFKQQVITLIQSVE